MLERGLTIITSSTIFAVGKSYLLPFRVSQIVLGGHESHKLVTCAFMFQLFDAISFHFELVQQPASRVSKQFFKNWSLLLVVSHKFPLESA